jgi:hypothetical protein
LACAEAPTWTLLRLNKVKVTMPSLMTVPSGLVNWYYTLLMNERLSPSAREHVRFASAFSVSFERLPAIEPLRGR